MNRVFVSYRIEDCKTVAGRLDADLTRVLGREAVFRDTTRLLGAQDWPTAIEDHARSCRIMLVLIGPKWQTAAFEDEARKGLLRLNDPEDWVRREIRLALDAGNAVLPILVNGAAMPLESWLASCGLQGLHLKQGLRLHDDDYDAHLATLLAAIQRHCPALAARSAGVVEGARRDFYRHVALPPHHVPREAVLAALAAEVLAAPGAVALTSGGAARPAAIHGMGGIGKSVLARALCEHPEIRTAFPDGILWTTLGQTPNLKSGLRDWLGALGATVTGPAPTIEAMSEALARALEARACLLIVDDVWMAEHLRAFAVAGPRCRLVVTTRNAALARHAGARVHPVHTMADDEALRLLEIWADGHLAATSANTKQAILARLGGLPLAIKLAGARLQRTPADVWLATFEGLRGLDAVAGAADRDGSVRASLRLSLDALDARERRRFAALAIFLEDEPIPIAAIAMLWSGWTDATPGATQRQCDAFAELALVELAAEGRAVVMHDLVRQVATDELGAEAAEAHCSLVAAYAAAAPGAGWAEAVDDGYLYDHLAYHLVGARDVDALRRLFDDQAWMWVRLRCGDHRLDGYLDDLDRLWDVATTTARHQLAIGAVPEALVDCVRCAVIRTTINSGANTYVPPLIARAVELGLWSLDRALSTIERVPDVARRFDCLVDLLALANLDHSSRRRVTELAWRVVEQRDRDGTAGIYAVGHGRLAAHADEAYVDAILASLLRSAWHFQLPSALAYFLPRADDSRLRQLFAAVPMVQVDPGASAPRHELLALLAPRLPDALVEPALALALETRSHGRIASLVAFLPRLEPAQRARVIDLAWAEASAPVLVVPEHLRWRTGFRGSRAVGLAALIDVVSAERRREASAMCLQDLQGMCVPDEIVDALGAFGRSFDTADLAGVLEVVRTLPERGKWGVSKQVQAIMRLARCLHGAGLDPLIDGAIQAILQDQRSSELLGLLPAAWTARCVAQILADEPARYEHVIAGLLPYVARSEREALVRACPAAAVSTVRMGGPDVAWGLADDLDPDLLDRFVDAILASLDRGDASSGGSLPRHYDGFYTDRERGLMWVAGNLSAAQVARCLGARDRLHDELPFVRLLGALLSVMRDPEGAVAIALQLALSMPEEAARPPGARDLVLAILAPHLSETQRAACVAHLVQGTSEVAHLFGLAALISHLADAARADAVALGRSLAAGLASDDIFHAPALAALLPHLPDHERPLAVEQLLGRLKQGYVGHDATLAAALPFLDPSGLAHVVRALSDRGDRFQSVLLDAVRLLAAHLSEPEAESLAGSLRVHTEGPPSFSRRGYVLALLQLVSRLGSPQREDIIARALDELRDTTEVWDALGYRSLYGQVVESLPDDAVGRAVELALDNPDAMYRIEGLRALIPRLAGAVRDQAIEVFVRDVEALAGLNAINELEGAVLFLLDDPQLRRWAVRQLVDRLHTDRALSRRHLVYALARSGLLCEALVPRAVLAEIGRIIVAIYGDWTAP